MNQFPAFVKRHLRSQVRSCLDGLPLLTPMSALEWHTCSRRQLLMAEEVSMVRWHPGISGLGTANEAMPGLGRKTGLGLLPAPFFRQQRIPQHQTAIDFPAMR